jgi:hypothetical protein
VHSIVAAEPQSAFEDAIRRRRSSKRIRPRATADAATVDTEHTYMPRWKERLTLSRIAGRSAVPRASYAGAFPRARSMMWYA